MMLIYGHRGAKGDAPENTLPGFRLCLDAGVTRCELDLQLSRDNQLMVIHDPNLKRLSGDRVRVRQKTAAELKKYDVCRSVPGWSNCQIPTLPQLLACCAFDHWQLEVKPLSRKKSVIAVQAIAGLAEEFELHDMLCITSSSKHVLKAAREHAPQLARGLVAENAYIDPVTVALRHDCSLLALNWKLCSEKRVQKARRNGLHVSAWTVNEPGLMLALAQRGVDSLITDFPGLASATLGNGSITPQK